MKKLIKYLVIAALVFTSLGIVIVFLWQAFEKKGIADSLYEAESFFKEKKYAEAKVAIQEVLNQDSLNEKALRLSAEIAEMEYNYPLAALLWKRLVSLNPLDESLGYRYVSALNSARNFRETISFLEKRRKTGNLLSGEMLELARAELEMGNLIPAKHLWEELDKGLVNQDDYSLLTADILLLENNKDEARKTYEWLARKSEKTTVRFFALLRLSMYVTDIKREKLLKEAAATFPLLGNAVLADFYLIYGRFQEVVDVLEKVPNTERSFLQARQLGEAYAALQQIDKINALVKKIPTGNREGIVLKYYLEALSAFLNKDFEKTLVRLESCQDFSDRPLYNFLQLESRAALNAPPSGIIGNAKAMIESAGDNAPKRIMDILMPLLQRYVAAKRYNDGLLLGGYLATLNLNLPVLDDILLICYLQTGKDDPQFAELTQKILARTPNHKNALLAASIQSAAANRPAEAKRYCLALLKEDPKSEFALTLLAGIEEQSKNLPDAEKYLRRALAANPENLDAADRLFMFLMRNTPGKVSEFADQYAADGKAAKTARAFVYKAFSALSAKDNAKAYALFQEALKNDKKIPIVYMNLATLSPTPSEKEKYLLEGNREFPGIKLFLLPLASMYAVENKNEKAAEIYENLLKQDPNDPLVLINYSEVLASMGQLERAMTLAVQARTVDTNDPRVRECYAMREFEQKNYSQVILELEALLKSNQNSPRIIDTLVKSLIEEGCRARKEPHLAKDYFLRALELRPDSKEARAELRKLEEEPKK